MSVISLELAHFRELVKKAPTKEQYNAAQHVYATTMPIIDDWLAKCMSPSVAIAYSVSITVLPYTAIITALFFSVIFYFVICKIKLDWDLYSIKRRVQACFDAAILCDLKGDVEKFFKEYGPLCQRLTLPNDLEMGTNAIEIYAHLAKTGHSQASRQHFDKLLAEALKSRSTPLLALTSRNMFKLRRILNIDGLIKEIQNHNMVDDSHTAKVHRECISKEVLQCEENIKEHLKEDFTISSSKKAFEIQHLREIVHHCPSANRDSLIKECDRVITLSKHEFSFLAWMESQRKG